MSTNPSTQMRPMESKTGLNHFAFKVYTFLWKREVISQRLVPMLKAFAGMGQIMSSKNNQPDFFMPAGIDPPENEAQLLTRAQGLAGLCIGQLAHQLQMELPSLKKHGKGFTGQLIETALGATAGNKAHPDFENLGIELKTLPVSPKGQVLETTFVCSIDLKAGFEKSWRDSRTFHKIEKVLFFPVEDDDSKNWHDLRLGMPFLWSPSADEEALLAQDWHDHMEIIGQGLSDGISARRGKVLQVRPKAANSRVRRQAMDAWGDAFEAKPIGFYLRRQFTQALLDRALAAK